MKSAGLEVFIPHSGKREFRPPWWEGANVTSWQWQFSAIGKSSGV
jgi:hypothetical protein